jgi:hypothetical protein
MRYDRSWPNAPIDRPWLNGWYRGEADGQRRLAYDREGRLQPSRSLKKLNGARRLPDSKVVAQLDDSERSHFVTSFSSLQLLLGCT